MSNAHRPTALFAGVTYAGWKTRQLNLERHVAEDGRLDARYRRISGWCDGGLLERLPLVPRGIAGRARAQLEARGFATFPRPDVVWTSALELATPYLWANYGPLRRPLVCETDWTFEQQELFAHEYFHREPRTGLRRAFSALLERVLFDRVTLFTPISRWAADGLRHAGIDDARIHVLHPGLDLERWSVPERRADPAQPLRLLFVGGDFERKGGPELVDVVATRFPDEIELDIVTRDRVEPRPNVRVHRAEPNSPLLFELYAQADLFVLPTRAECFGHVTVEALASGLPAIVSDVGGARDIVDDGVTGWLIEPGAAAIAAALQRALDAREVLPRMGAAGRRVAEERFDGRRNDRVLVDLLLDQVARHRHALRPSEVPA